MPRKRSSKRPKPPYHHGDLRRALLDAAESVLADEGVEGFTLRECARRAGVSHGAPAHHFADVRGLLTEFTAESFEQLTAAMRARRAAALPDPVSQLDAVGAGYVEYALANRARFQLMFRSDRLDPENVRLADAAGAAYAQLVETMTAVCAALGEPEKLQGRIALAWSLVHGFATLMLDNAMFAAQAASPAQALELLGRLTRLSREGLSLSALRGQKES